MNHIELVRQAQRGDHESLDRLAESARQRLNVYIYRLTLESELTEEIVQETLLEMCKILGKLRKADRFWPWLYGIAINKLRRYYRTEHTNRKLATSKANSTGTIEQRQKGLENLVSQELKQIVSQAIRKLRTRHRAVLIMRCYDDMSYAQIAEAMGCSEYGTRMLFLRAKKALQKELSRNGFGKGSLLAALVLFGKMTAPTEAAAAKVSVTAATTEVGVVTSVVGFVTSKTAILSLTAAGVITTGAVVTNFGTNQATLQRSSGKVDQSFNIGSLGQIDNGSEQYWYFFPEGPDGPMMMRASSGKFNERAYWQFLQNDRANYYFHNNIVYINNHRMWDKQLHVMRMPVDEASLINFISGVEAKKDDMQYITGSGKGLLVIATRNRDEDNNRSWAVRHYNVLDEGYFKSDWPAGVKIIDNRDAMHERGWTYLKITGRINGQKVSGTARVPFVYAARKRFSPWLKINIGEDLEIVDTMEGACIYDRSAKRTSRYEAGSFFKGLARPWMGLHTIDTVRRDAAEREILFDTGYDSDSSKAQVELSIEGLKLIYIIDLQADIIDRISFLENGMNKGYLEFSYLQDVENVGREFFKPENRSYRGPLKESIGLLWLVRVVEGSLVK